MTVENLQELCELGQQQLMQTHYLQAESTLVQAESIALRLKDFDTLSRLYMPLQEARRQRRQRCGEGVVCLDLVSQGPADRVDGERIIENYPHGQLLVAGWGSIDPAVKLRQSQAAKNLYVETFFAALYPLQTGAAVVILPLAEVALPDPAPRTKEQLAALLPPHCIVMDRADLPAGSVKGTAETFSRVMQVWERLHTPFLAAADALSDPMQKIHAYRKTIEVDYACELAHQKLSDVAKRIAHG